MTEQSISVNETADALDQAVEKVAGVIHNQYTDGQTSANTADLIGRIQAAMTGQETIFDPQGDLIGQLTEMARAGEQTAYETAASILAHIMVLQEILPTQLGR